jgi:hypothetical protein
MGEVSRRGRLLTLTLDRIMASRPLAPMTQPVTRPLSILDLDNESGCDPSRFHISRHSLKRSRIAGNSL